MTLPTTRSVLLIADNSLQTSLLKQVLETELKLAVLTLQPSELGKEKLADHNLSLCVIDYSVIDDSMVSQYQKHFAPAHPAMQEVLINCSEENATAQLTIWPNLCGIFYREDDFTMLQQGLNRVLSGEMWFSRKVSQDYIMLLRQHSRPIQSDFGVNLTKREQEILSLLAHGKTNQQMAKLLIVSENTIKTHLHNVFKKIGVDNRVQALIWANERNLSDASIAL